MLNLVFLGSESLKIIFEALSGRIFPRVFSFSSIQLFKIVKSEGTSTAFIFNSGVSTLGPTKYRAPNIKMNTIIPLMVFIYLFLAE